MNELCTDGRFEVIARAKEDLLRCTNIDTSPSEISVLDEILFRCWQMGWLNKYEKHGQWKIETKRVSYWCCSKCGASAPLDYNGQYELSNYCPNCGEKMENADPSDKVHI